MLDNLYTDIGGKIKGLAKGIFVVEAIGAIITGFTLLLADSTLAMYGLLTMFFGPIVAWISSWILYALGELVDKACAIERNTRGGKNTSQVQEVSQVQEASVIEKNEEVLSPDLPVEEKWSSEISQLSTEELQKICKERFEWSKAYRKLCQEELNKRSNNQ